VEKLEGEKQKIEQQNAFLLQRLAQVEAENSRLNCQVAQLSAEIRGSRGTTPKSVSPDSTSPTLTPTLFKHEREELSLDKIPFPTPSIPEFSPSMKPTDLVASSDLTQHPAAMLCGLQCQSEDSKDRAVSVSCPSWTPDQASSLALQVTLQLLFLMMTSAAYSTVIRPLSQILTSLKTGSPLTLSTEDIYRHLPLIHWLISNPNLSRPSMASTTRRSVFRMRLLTRLLACSPALARPLRDATGKALQLAVSEVSLRPTGSAVVGASEAGQDWQSLLTMAWAIDSIERRNRNRRRQRVANQTRALTTSLRSRQVRRNQRDNMYYGSTRSSWSLGNLNLEDLSSILMGKPC
jgi:transcriptional activator HAC1